MATCKAGIRERWRSERLAAALAVACLALLAGCGNRLPLSQLQADAGLTQTGSPGTSGVSGAAAPADVAGGVSSAGPAVAAAGGDGSGSGSSAVNLGTAPAGASAGGSGPSAVGPTSAGSDGTGAGSVGTTTGQANGAAPAATATRAGAVSSGRRAAGSTQATAAAAASPAAAAASAPCTSSGAPLVLGQDGSFSGLVGAAVSGLRTGLQVWAKDVNARGGIACHPVQIYQEDSGSDPSKASQNTTDLIENKHVQAFVAETEPIALSAYRSVADKAGIPDIGGDNVDPGWNSDPLLFGVGGYNESDYEGGIKEVKDTLGLTKFGMVYCVEAAVCSNGYQRLTAPGGWAAQTGVDVVYTQSISLTQTDFTSECQNAKNAGVQMLFLFADGASAQRLASDCKNLGYTVPLIIPSIAVNPSLTADPNLNSFGVYLATYTAPDVANDSPALQAFHAAYARYAGSAVPDAPGLQAWASGKMLEAAIDTLGPSARSAPITTAVILKGLANIKNETLGGLVPPTTYPPGQQAVLGHCYGILQIKNSAFVAPHGSQLFCPAGF